MTTVETIRSKCRYGYLSITVQNKIIRLNVIEFPGTAIFDICTPEGSVLLTGRLHQLDSGVIDMTAFAEGIYEVYVFHGENIYCEQIALRA